MDHIESVPCNQPPQNPIHVGAYAISSTRVAVVWDKPIGGGYKYKVAAKSPGQSPITGRGEQGFGNAGFYELFGLTPKTNYSVSVQLECNDNPGKFSQAATTFVMTLISGKI